MDEPRPTAAALGVAIPTPAELEDFFNTDPGELTDLQLKQIVAAYEQKAADWAKDEAAGKKQAQVPRLQGSAADILAGLGLGKPKT